MNDSERRLRTGPELRDLIASTCETAEIAITVFSAFVKLSGLEWLSAHVISHPKIRIVSRWKIEDLAVGASDLDAYSFCRDRGWQFGIDQALHSKAYVFDHEVVFLGSSNLTASGLSLDKRGNLELGTAIQPTRLDLNRLQRLEDSCCWLNDELFEKIRAEVTPHIKTNTNLQFSETLMKRLRQPVKLLWVSELPHSTPQRILMGEENDDCRNDIVAFDLGADEITESSLKAAFKNSRIRDWLFELLETSEDGFTNFGWLTSNLHNSVLDEPPPNRRDVKHYTACLVEWLKFCESDVLEFTQHRRTVSFKLK